MGLFDAGRMMQATTGYDEVLDYLRDGVVVAPSVPCKAGATIFRTEDLASSLSLRVFRQDFLVEAASIPCIERPEPGDEIVWRGRRFLVSAPDGEPCWRWRGASMTSWRIHAEEESDDGR